MILVQVDRLIYVQCRDEFLRNYIAYSFLSLNMNSSFFEIQCKDNELRALSLSCIAVECLGGQPQKTWYIYRICTGLGRILICDYSLVDDWAIPFLKDDALSLNNDYDNNSNNRGNDNSSYWLLGTCSELSLILTLYMHISFNSPNTLSDKNVFL